VARELESLERAVGALLEELDALRRRVASAEDRSGKLEATLKASGVRPGEAADLEGRLGELSRENEQLREVIKQARERADRIRSRLIVMEDES
jgi:chromosome segregation ATPase